MWAKQCDILLFLKPCPTSVGIRWTKAASKSKGSSGCFYAEWGEWSDWRATELSALATFFERVRQVQTLLDFSQVILNSEPIFSGQRGSRD